MAKYYVIEEVITGIHPVVHKIEAKDDDEADRIFTVMWRNKLPMVLRSELCKILKGEGR